MKKGSAINGNESHATNMRWANNVNGISPAKSSAISDVSPIENAMGTLMVKKNRRLSTRIISILLIPDQLKTLILF